MYFENELTGGQSRHIAPLNWCCGSHKPAPLQINVGYCHRWMDTYQWDNKQNEYWHILMFGQWIDAINTNSWCFEAINAFFVHCVLNLFVSFKDQLKAVYVLFLSFKDCAHPILPMISVTYPWYIKASAHLFLRLQISLVNMLSHLFLVSKQSSALSMSVY